MPTPRLIGHPASDTPADLQTTSGRPRRLPDDLLRQASKRLQILALLAAALWFLGPALGHLAIHFAAPNDSTANQFRVLDGIAAAAIATSLGLYLYLRRSHRDPSFVLDLGLAYLVLTSVYLGVMIHWGPASAMPLNLRPMITWIGPVILMTAAILPADPRKMLVAGFIAASMDPIGMVVARAAGVYRFDSVLDTLAMHYPNYLMLGVAVVISGVVTRLGQQVTKAREMGSYRLGDPIGRGGMGEVYLAHHRMLARPAAIKLIRPEALANDGDGSQAQLAAARFRREAEAAARLKSPHTVQLYDFGVTEDGRLYLVMELLEGINLDQLVRRDGPLPATRVAHILRQACESLEEAHDSGLVHRDIKPANIHLGRVGRQDDFVKLLDFGLVKSVAGSGDDSLASLAGMAVGTPAYMAPEMARGDAVDGRADLYSLGCVAYYLLTGQLVFAGETPIQTVLLHVQQEPVPPSQRTGNCVPSELEQLVLRCLAKRPDARPQSAGALMAALDRFLLSAD